MADVIAHDSIVEADYGVVDQVNAQFSAALRLCVKKIHALRICEDSQAKRRGIHYSPRSTSIGSTVDARRAGINAAPSPATATTPNVADATNGSSADTSNKKRDNNRDARNAPPMPAPIPAPTLRPSRVRSSTEISRRRAHRLPKRELATPLYHREHQHRVTAGDRQRQRDGGEGGERAHRRDFTDL